MLGPVPNRWVPVALLPSLLAGLVLVPLTAAGGHCSQSKDWRDFAIGDIIDAQDTVGKWYESTIRDVKDDRIFVHYNGWPQVGLTAADITW